MKHPNASPRNLLIATALLAVALLLASFVNVLNSAVERGEQWRAAQRLAASSGKPVQLYSGVTAAMRPVVGVN